MAWATLGSNGRVGFPPGGSHAFSCHISPESWLWSSGFSPTLRMRIWAEEELFSYKMVTPRMDFARAKIKSVIDYKVLRACSFTDLLHSGSEARGGSGILVSSTPAVTFSQLMPQMGTGTCWHFFCPKSQELWKSREELWIIPAIFGQGPADADNKNSLVDRGLWLPNQGNILLPFYLQLLACVLRNAFPLQSKEWPGWTSHQIAHNPAPL